MIEALRNDEIIEKLGGRFKLASLIQRRLLELIQGARPMVDPKGLTDIEVVIREIEEDKIEFEPPQVIRLARPSSTMLSRVCVRSYTTPTTAKKRAVIMPWENICRTAPVTPKGCNVAIPIRTYPMWLTLE